MKISIVMPCYLGHYKNAASNRDDKLGRAIESIQAQSYPNWELLVIADGCDQTVRIVSQNYLDENDGRIKLFKIEKQKPFSGNARNAGVQKATGEWICYLDADDVFLPDHLENIANGVGDLDWCWFNCSSWDKKMNGFNELECNIDKKGQCGTSNFAHRADIKAYWSPNGGYAKDDWIMINTLKSLSKNYGKVDTIGYGICHVPTLLDY